jgi:hypothetical protein
MANEEPMWQGSGGECVGVRDGKVRIAVMWESAQLPPDAAREFARALVEAADAAERGE